MIFLGIMASLSLQRGTGTPQELMEEEKDPEQTAPTRMSPSSPDDYRHFQDTLSRVFDTFQIHVEEVQEKPH